MLGKFVTAKLFREDDCRQGYVISLIPLVIQGVSGIYYHCEGTPVLVVNPPPDQMLKQTPKAVPLSL